MVGSSLLIVLGVVVTVYAEMTGPRLSDGPFTMFLEGRLGGLLMGLLTSAVLRTLLSIDARLEQKA